MRRCSVFSNPCRRDRYVQSHESGWRGTPSTEICPHHDCAIGLQAAQCGWPGRYPARWHHSRRNRSPVGSGLGELSQMPGSARHGDKKRLQGRPIPDRPPAPRRSFRNPGPLSRRSQPDFNLVVYLCAGPAGNAGGGGGSGYTGCSTAPANGGGGGDGGHAAGTPSEAD